METVIKKSGSAFIHIGITRTKKLKDIIPAEAKVHSLLPGLSFYAVGAFKYDDVSDMHPGNEHYSWKNCVDTTIQIPIDLHSSKKLFYIKRLYNTNDEVVEWAKGYKLKKIHSNMMWKNKKNKYRIRLNSNGSESENITITGKSLVRIPNFLWKFGALKSIAEAFMLSEYDNEFYCFQGVLDLEKSYIGTGSSTVVGLDLPKPLFSFSLTIKNFRPLHIKPFMKLYHKCEYNNIDEKKKLSIAS